MERPGNFPIFVVGSARSGTTLLYSILVSSGEFPVYEAETLLLENLAIKYGSLRKEQNYTKFMRHWMDSKQFLRSGLEREEFEKGARFHSNSYIEFLSFFMDSMAKNQGMSRWAEKTPSHLHHMRKLLKVFSDAKFIHIIRDGRDVAISRRKLGWIGIRSKNPVKQLLFAAIEWEFTVNRGRHIGKKLGDNYFEIQYEDLITNLDDVISRVNKFANLQIDRQKIANISTGSLKKANTAFSDKMDGISPKPLYRWKRELNKEEQESINMGIGRTLRQFGYEVPKRDGVNEIQPYLKIMCMKSLYRFLLASKRIIRTKFLIGRFLPNRTVNYGNARGSD